MARLSNLRARLVSAAIASIPVATLPFTLGGGCQRTETIRGTVSEVRAQFAESESCEDGHCEAALAACLRTGECMDACRASVSHLGCGGQGNISVCELERDGDGEPVLVVRVTSACPAGRRPVGFAGATAPDAVDPVAGWLARQACLEAASVPAFAHLARELAHHGAPIDLIRGALRSARDEVAHAQRMTELARCRGVEPMAPQLRPAHVRPLQAVAVDNEVEGCVRETVGAALCWRQAIAATAPDVRAAMAAIADDETRHAALAARISEWARRQPRVDVAALDDARARAVAEVRTELCEDAPATLGLPRGDQVDALVDAAL